jgi:hypothetical protein
MLLVRFLMVNADGAVASISCHPLLIPNFYRFSFIKGSPVWQLNFSEKSGNVC